MFITFEGGEGAGKSTQARRLRDALEARGYHVWLTREPGGTPLAEAIRQVVLAPEQAIAAMHAQGLLPQLGNISHDAVTPAAELLLMNAARAQLVQAIRGALEQGTIVICDRYADATLAYQGGGRGLDVTDIRAVNDIATGGLRPDITFLLDLDPAQGIRRKAALGHPADEAGEWNRLDAETDAFHARVRMVYRDLAQAEPDRWQVLDAAQPPETLADQMLRAVLDRLEIA